MPESQSSLTGLAVPLTAGAERPRARILVVDDEPRNGRLMRMVLRAEGYTTTVAASGQEALDTLESQPVDLIILDVMMPEMSGFEVCRILRARPATHFLPVILVTALSDVGDRVQGIEAGADDFISKPFNEVELRARVRSLLRIKDLHDKLEQRNNLLLDALQRAVSPGVAEQILADPARYLRPGGERRSVTILFGDIRGYTSLAEESRPHEAMTILNTYLARIISAVYDFGGTVNQVLGDGVMALFGAPLDTPEHARHAVAAALAIQRAVGEVEVEDYPRVRLQMGIGINSGDVVVGHIGSDQRMDYTAVGDAVNLAARFEQSAGPGQILVTQATYDQIADHFEVTPIGTLRVRNREGWAQGYSVLRAK
ncbi:MAG TPA: adenylate/guanylate cyclase domain-containing protein [Chloroflexota bacterium]|nr:adenylate/guanylate cyclase domain-containing protein [Chloroflexota bacterium]